MGKKITKETFSQVAAEARVEYFSYREKGLTLVTVHLGTCGIAAGAEKTMAALKAEIAARKLTKVQLVRSGCVGLCSAEPMLTVELPGADPVRYTRVDPAGALEILTGHVQGGKPVVAPKTKGLALLPADSPFYAKQVEIALRHRGRIDPESLSDYLALGGYSALQKTLTRLTPTQVLEEVKRSGLRGRGGGGFPAGVKWESCIQAVKKTAKAPVVVCNADEGDPGAYMDRSLLESDPHGVIEGMILGGYAVGAKEGLVYVRREYPGATAMLTRAIAAAREAGLLGSNILGGDFSFDLVIHQGAGAFVCGESTALMASMEGRVGEPRAKYIHNVESGYQDRPTVLNNVETWANIPAIIAKGGAWFGAIGTGDVSTNPWDGSAGTKVFSLVGKVKNAGLVEVPMGITLREIIFEIGGGIPHDRKFKAVQTGGPSGGCLPASFLDEPVDFDSLTAAGSMMGSGGMIVMDDQTCMVDVARYFIEFLKDESCGKCTPCREGLTNALEILTRITRGEGKAGDLDLLVEVGEWMSTSALCALGTSAANPVTSTLKYFRDEYEAHINDRRCPGGICPELITYSIIPETCNGCHLCTKACPVAAISGEPKQPHDVDAHKCTKCGACYSVCKRNAIIRK